MSHSPDDHDDKIQRREAERQLAAGERLDIGTLRWWVQQHADRFSYLPNWMHIATEEVYTVIGVVVREEDMELLVHYAPHNCERTGPHFVRPLSEWTPNRFVAVREEKVWSRVS